jgi:DNA replication protein DnaC
MINEYATRLLLPYIRDNYRQLVEEARHAKPDYEQFLQNILECEWQRRAENSIVRRIREAKFPLKKYLVDFDRKKYDEAFSLKFDELETLGRSFPGPYPDGRND